MMKWHFADIKIGQFVLDVVECSCREAVSYQNEKVHVFFFPLIDPGSKQQERDFGVWVSAEYSCFTFTFLKFQAE